MSENSKNTAAIKAYWEAFQKENKEIELDTPYEVWYFGDSQKLADELAELVVCGKKTATASLFWEYEAEEEALPTFGGYSVITTYDGEPRGVIQTTEVRILPFDEVEADFAGDEGEGDLTLDFWRNAHWRFFSRTCTRLGREPDQKMPVVCERFRLLYVGR